MKTLFVLIFLFSIGGVVDVENAKEKYFLSIKTEKEQYKPCESIYIDITLTNNSEKLLTIYETSNEKDYKVIVTDDKGKEINLTQYGENLKELVIHHRMVVTKISTKESTRCRILINRLYDMTLSGEYVIKVKRSAENIDGTDLIELESNTIKLKVL